MQQGGLSGVKTKYELILLAKISQQTERYSEMAVYSKKLLLSDDQLTSAQRNLCASAYKNIVSNRRAELKVLDAISRKLTQKDDEQMQSALKMYRKKIENELRNCCLDVVSFIENKIIPAKVQIKSVEAKVFYLKMQADFYRYLCALELDNDEFYNSASKCYQEADGLARSNLPPTNQVRVSLHLNMSVFLYERCGETERALELANRAFDDAVANVSETNEQSFKNCTMILQLIRDNISLWSGEVQES